MRRLVTIVLVSSSVGACTTDATESIIVLKNVIPGAGCTFQSSESEGFVTHGTLDITGNAPYLFAGQMKSRVQLNTDPTGTGSTTSDVDANTIFLRSANIDLAFPGTTPPGIPADLTHFKKLFSAVLRPSAITDATFELIPADLAKQILATNPTSNIEVEATFTVIGDLSGGGVSSQPFVFPVTLGVGISKNNLGMCPLAKGTAVRTGNVCNAAQDGVIDCCTDPTSNTQVCPATVTP